ncbi:MAG: heptosyltransferase-1 [Rhodothermales bacterium]|jgi:heptosyltransferase-1
MRVLIIKPSSLGDIVHTLPVARVLRTRFPDAEIHWLINDSFLRFGGLFKDVDRLIPFRRKEWAKPQKLGDFFRFLRELRNTEYDLVLDFQGLFRSGLCALAAGGETWGFKEARELAPLSYRHRVKIPSHIRHAVEKNLYLLSAALGESCRYESPRLGKDGEAAAAAEELRSSLGMQGRLIAIGPMSRWPSKSWPPAFFAKTLLHVLANSADDVHAWLLGAPEERDVGEEILSACGHPRLHNLMGRTSLPAMIELLRTSSLMLTNDSGPMHIAASLELPTVALFGPTDPTLTGPYGDRHRVFQSKVDCAPCFQRLCPLPRQLCRDDVISPEAVGSFMVEQLRIQSNV